MKKKLLLLLFLSFAPITGQILAMEMDDPKESKHLIVDENPDQMTLNELFDQIITSWETLERPEIDAKQEELSETINQLIEKLINFNTNSNNINMTNKKREISIAMLAAGFIHNPEIIELLLEHGANVNQTDKSGATPLFYAAIYNTNPEIIKLLLDHDANVNQTDNDNMTPLSYAIMHDANLKSIKSLLEHGAKVNQTDNDNMTPLSYAIMHDANPEIIKSLLEHDANVNTVDKEKFTPLMEALQDAHPNVDIIKLLLKYGADVNMTNAYKDTALIMAILNNYDQTSRLEIIKLLLDRDADANKVNLYGHTALTIALKNNLDLEILKLLLKYGAHVTPEDIDLALHNNRPDIAELLSYYIKAH